MVCAQSLPYNEDDLKLGGNGTKAVKEHSFEGRRKRAERFPFFSASLSGPYGRVAASGRIRLREGKKS